MPGEHGVGFALNLALMTCDSVSDDGATLICPRGSGGGRLVIENSSGDPVAPDQETFVGKFYGCLLVDECR